MGIATERVLQSVTDAYLEAWASWLVITPRLRMLFSFGHIAFPGSAEYELQACVEEEEEDTDDGWSSFMEDGAALDTDIDGEYDDAEYGDELVQDGEEEDGVVAAVDTDGEYDDVEEEDGVVAAAVATKMGDSGASADAYDEANVPLTRRRRRRRRRRLLQMGGVPTHAVAERSTFGEQEYGRGADEEENEEEEDDEESMGVEGDTAAACKRDPDYPFPEMLETLRDDLAESTGDYYFALNELSDAEVDTVCSQFAKLDAVLLIKTFAPKKIVRREDFLGPSATTEGTLRQFVHLWGSELAYKLTYSEAMWHRGDPGAFTMALDDVINAAIVKLASLLSSSVEQVNDRVSYMFHNHRALQGYPLAYIEKMAKWFLLSPIEQVRSSLFRVIIVYHHTRGCLYRWHGWHGSHRCAHKRERPLSPLCSLSPPLSAPSRLRRACFSLSHFLTFPLFHARVIRCVPTKPHC